MLSVPLSPVNHCLCPLSPPPIFLQIKDIQASGRSVSTAHTGLKGLLGAEDRPLAVASGPLLAVTWGRGLATNIEGGE